MELYWCEHQYQNFWSTLRIGLCMLNTWAWQIARDALPSPGVKHT
jgi:hypothetical protein